MMTTMTTGRKEIVECRYIGVVAKPLYEMAGLLGKEIRKGKCGYYTDALI